MSDSDNAVPWHVYAQPVLLLIAIAIGSFAVWAGRPSAYFFIYNTCPFWLLLAIVAFFVRQPAKLATYFVVIHTLVAIGIVAWVISGVDVEPWMRSFTLIYVDLPLFPLVWLFDLLGRRLRFYDLIYQVGPFLSLFCGGVFYGTVGWIAGRHSD